MFQLMETLEYLHENKIVHRNIKSTNILYDPHTKNMKLVGFVLAKKFR